VGSEMADLTNNLAPLGLEANIIKSVTTDMMQEASQSLLQLVGAKGFRLNHIAGRGVVDSRPFQIFEGSNDILYIQISETVLKLMSIAKENNFLQFLKNFHLSSHAAGYLKNLLDFSIDKQLPQRKLAALGLVISRIVAMDYVISVGDRGFPADLINGATQMLHQEITTLINDYSFSQSVNVVMDYEENSFWLNWVR
jgi:hypothetical protein